MRSSFDVGRAAAGSPEQEPQPQEPAPSPDVSLDAAATVQLPCFSGSTSFMSTSGGLLDGFDGSTAAWPASAVEVRLTACRCCGVCMHLCRTTLSRTPPWFLRLVAHA